MFVHLRVPASSKLWAICIWQWRHQEISNLGVSSWSPWWWSQSPHSSSIICLDFLYCINNVLLCKCFGTRSVFKGILYNCICCTFNFYQKTIQLFCHFLWYPWLSALQHGESLTDVFVTGGCLIFLMDIYTVCQRCLIYCSSPQNEDFTKKTNQADRMLWWGYRYIIMKLFYWFISLISWSDTAKVCSHQTESQIFDVSHLHVTSKQRHDWKRTKK